MSSDISQRGRSEFANGWKVVLASVVGVACGGSPLPFNVLPTLFGPLIGEFGWTSLQISAGVTVFGVTAALLAPAYGAASDKFGVRPVTLISVLAFAGSFLAFYFMPPSLAGYYTMWFIVGLVGIGSTPVTWTRAINLWFFKRRGLALGLTLLGTSLAAIIVPRLATGFIETSGWRMMFVYIALLPLLVSFPLAFFLFREPRPEERPAEVQALGGNNTGFSLGEALKTGRFWLIFGSIVMIASAYGGAHIHMIEIVKSHGYEPLQAASVMGVVGLGILAGRVITGLLLDRFWAGKVAFPLLLLPAIACIMFTGQDGPMIVLIPAAFMLGFAAGAESDLIAYLTGRYFGMANYGKIYGMLYLPFGLFSAASPMVYGAVMDRTGSYDAMLFVASPMFVIGGAMLLFLGKYPTSFPDAEPDLAAQPALAE